MSSLLITCEVDESLDESLLAAAGGGRALKMHGLPSSALLAPPQVRQRFFAFIDEMMETLYQRGQDPNDTVVPATFRWRTFKEFPARLKYNMDEVHLHTACLCGCGNMQHCCSGCVRERHDDN